MSNFDINNVKCRYCQKSKLKPFYVSGKLLEYKCLDGCNSKFEVEIKKDFDGKRLIYFIKRVNPDYINKLNSSDKYQNLKITKKLNKNNIPIYSNVYEIGSVKITENNCEKD